MAVVTSILTGGSNNHETTSEEANAIATDFIGEGIVSTVANTSGVAPATGGFAVNAQGTPDMTVAVGSGVAYVTGTPTSQNSQQFRVKNSASSNVTISANASGSTKYDWVYISLSATNLNTPNTAGDNVATLTTSRSSSASTDDGTPPTYGYAIAVVTVANGETAITNSMIRDVRSQCGVSAGATTSSSTWTDTGYAPGTVTYNGNRSYQCVFSNTDLTGFLSNGMRLKLTRTTAPPTQCTDLESGSSQYWSKTSPAGISFTTTFTCAAWVKLESYGAFGGIIARRNASTEGWSLSVDTDGTIELLGARIAANNKQIQSYQSIPLNKWVHVAACLDMTVGDTTAQKIWIDGVEVPRVYTLTGTATALVQGTTALVVGAAVSAGTSLFDGKIAQASVHSACLSDAQIKAMASQTISSSTPSIVSGFTFDGAATDVSANANDLSANGGAVATTVDSPFNSTEYGIITANAFSTDTTLTVQVPEGYAIPTSGGVSAVSYSTQAVPYGFPADKGKWSLYIPFRTGQTGSTSTTQSNIAGAVQSFPIGKWEIIHEGDMSVTGNAGSDYRLWVSESTAGAAILAAFINTILVITYGHFKYFRNTLTVDLSSATTYYLVQDATGTISSSGINQLQITANFNYV